MGATAPTGHHLQKIEQARPKVAAVLARVHERAPKARVAIVG